MKNYTSKNYAKRCFLNNERTLESGHNIYYPKKMWTVLYMCSGINRGPNNVKKVAPYDPTP